METVETRFSNKVSAQLEQFSRVQALLVAACTMERLWMLFEGWTKHESAPYLHVKPETFRRPARYLLDLFWEQIWKEQPYGDYLEEYNRFHNQVQSSFDENDGQDVDFGDARLLLDAIECYGFTFFDTPEAVSKRRERQRSGFYIPFITTTRYITSCVTLYAYRLFYDFLPTEFCIENSIRRIDKEQQPLVDDYVEQHPLWREEVARIEDDISAAHDYPSNKELFMARKELYSNLQLPSLRC